jgi:hypothetical protein
MPPRRFLKFSTRRSAFFVVLLCFAGRLATASEDDDHDDHDHDDHDDHEECVCLAAEQGWTIDCSNMDPVVTAISYLENTDACATTSHTEECEKQYHIMQSHHDHCTHESMDESMERVIHDFEHLYEDCEISRAYDDELDMCPDVTCSAASTELGDARATLTANNCNSNCDSDACKTLFHKLVKAHDTCDEDDLPTTLENTLHDFEETCTPCNSYSQTPELDYDHCPAHSDARAKSFGGAMLMIPLPFLVHRP